MVMLVMIQGMGSQWYNTIFQLFIRCSDAAWVYYTRFGNVTLHVYFFSGERRRGQRTEDRAGGLCGGAQSSRRPQGVTTSILKCVVHSATCRQWILVKPGLSEIQARNLITNVTRVCCRIQKVCKLKWKSNRGS